MAIVALQQASYSVEAELIGFDGIPGLHETVDDVMALDLEFAGTLDATELVGIVGFRRLGRVVDIDRLAVAPSAFRRGVGRGLLDAVHRAAPAAERFVVSTAVTNVPAVGLYEGAGYVRMRTELITGVEVAHFAREAVALT